MRAEGSHAECMNGHLLRLAGTSMFYSHGLNMHATACDLCTDLRLARHAWFTVDHTVVRSADAPADPRGGAEFVLYPPRVSAGIGEVQLRFDGQPVARVRLQMCGVDRRGVIVHVETKESHRRRRMATVLIACVLARGSRYQWSSVEVPNTLESRAFCASLATAHEVRLGEPHYCSHMGM